MTFDPRHFPRHTVIDTCAVWNLLSAKKLFVHAAAQIQLTTTRTVIFECLHKPRKSHTTKSTELRFRLINAQGNGHFKPVESSLSTLLSIAATAPRGLSHGELSCIAAAIDNKGSVFMTDEKPARRYAQDVLSLNVQTTPRLYGWLHYHRHLIDSDHAEIISEHENFESRPLTKYLNIGYESALMYRLMNRTSQNSA